MVNFDLSATAVWSQVSCVRQFCTRIIASDVRNMNISRMLPGDPYIIQVP